MVLNLPQTARMLNNRFDAYRLLRELGAPARLIRHVELVGEAADVLIQRYQSMGLMFDAQLVELGVAVHDAGKTLYPAELHGPGSLHEAAGKQLMIEHGVLANIARCCVTHAAWSDEGVTLEERTVALADKLWKGKREPELELLVVDEVAARLGIDRWTVFAELDSTFEDITAGAADRLSRSQV
jgi:hypothetical protein